MPSWTLIDETKELADEKIVAPVLDNLARRWTDLNALAERRRWARESDDEMGYGPEFDDEEGADAFNKYEQVQARIHAAQVRCIEAQMAELGARIMRPYEHWNEDEQYVQWMEAGRFGES